MTRALCLMLAGAVTVASSLGCGDVPGPAGPEDEAPAQITSPPLFPPCPGAEEGPTGLMGADLVREGTAGTIDVRVLFCNPLIATPPDDLLFFITLEDHFGLAPSDLTRATSLTASGDLFTDGPFNWDGDDLTVDDHHAKGHLHGPRATADGTPVLGPDTTYLELTLGGIGGDGQIVARWEQAYLP